MADKQIGVVSNYFDHVKVAAIKLTAGVKIGDTVRFEGGESDFKQKINSMQIHHDKVDKAKKGDEIGIVVKNRVRKGYRVFKV
jgi:translation elongation factor EF-1alpha